MGLSRLIRLLHTTQRTPQCNSTPPIDDNLLQEARRITGFHSDRELVEYSLRLLLQLKQTDTHQLPQSTPENSIAALLASDFIGCANTEDTQLSSSYKTELTQILEKKHGYR